MTTPANDNICEWREKEYAYWETSCKNVFELTTDTPSANGMKYCCYCGKELKEVRCKE
jgi:hypothetical protein